MVRELSELVARGHEIGPATIESVSRVLDQAESPSKVLDEVVWRHRNLKVAPKSVNQKRYVDAIRRSTITFGVGPAGTGKTFLAMAMATAALSRREVNRIILTRPAVEAGERLGFLPGDLMAKVDPYLRPLFDALHDMMDAERVAAHLERGVIEVAPLAFMRGRTLNDSFVILDEAQNTSPEQMKMFLTRLGFGSKMVVTGDITQIDLPREQKSGWWWSATSSRRSRASSSCASAARTSCATSSSSGSSPPTTSTPRGRRRGWGRRTIAAARREPARGRGARRRAARRRGSGVPCVLAAATAGIEDGHVAVDVRHAGARSPRSTRTTAARPGPTDVLSFPVDGDGPCSATRELGDVVICPEHTEDLTRRSSTACCTSSGMDHETDEGEMLALQAEVVSWIR